MDNVTVVVVTTPRGVRMAPYSQEFKDQVVALHRRGATGWSTTTAETAAVLASCLRQGAP